MIEDPIANMTRLREIAEEGRSQPLLGGRHLILWGIAISLASLLHWAVVTRYLAWPPMMIAVIWSLLMIGAALLARTPITVGGNFGARVDLGNRVERAIWQYGGSLLGLAALAIFSSALIQLNANGDTDAFQLFAMMPPLTFGVYAIALRTSAEVSGVDKLKPYALTSLGFAALTIFLADTPAQLLAAAAGYLIVSILPGRILIGCEGTQAA